MLETVGLEREQCMGTDVGWEWAAVPKRLEDPQKPVILSRNGQSGEYTAENWIFRKTALPKDGLGAPSDQEKCTIGASQNAA